MLDMSFEMECRAVWCCYTLTLCESSGFGDIDREAFPVRDGADVYVGRNCGSLVSNQSYGLLVRGWGPVTGCAVGAS